MSYLIQDLPDWRLEDPRWDVEEPEEGEEFDWWDVADQQYDQAVDLGLI